MMAVEDDFSYKLQRTGKGEPWFFPSANAGRRPAFSRRSLFYACGAKRNLRVSFGKEGRKRKKGDPEMETDGRAGKQTDKNPPQASRRFPDTHNRSEKERECFERAFPGIFHCNSSASSVFLKAPGFFMQA